MAPGLKFERSNEIDMMMMDLFRTRILIGSREWKVTQSKIPKKGRHFLLQYQDFSVRREFKLLKSSNLHTLSNGHFYGPDSANLSKVLLGEFVSLSIIGGPSEQGKREGKKNRYSSYRNSFGLVLNHRAQHPQGKKCSFVT